MEQFTAFKKLFGTYVSFKSVSTDKQYQSQMKAVVEWLGRLLSENNFKVQVLPEKNSNPLVFGTFTVSPKAETVLVYGHYDVQPASAKDGWASDPFKLTENKGVLVGRGVVDNKGQNLIHIFTVLNLIKEKKLKYNVKFLIEGDEETGASNWQDIFKKYKSKFTADYVLVSDGEIAGEIPTFEASLRGGFNLTLTYTTGKNNLHSGIAGGAVPNAAHELSKFIAKLYNDKNQVTVPGFYNGVDPITNFQRKNNKAISTTIQILKLVGTKTLLVETGVDFYTQTGLRPTIQVTGFKAGYIEEGYANIVPAAAEARINFRIVKSQNPKLIYEAFQKYVKKNTPKYVDYKISVFGMHNPVKIDINSAKAKEVRALLKRVYGKEPIIKYVGGALPFVSSAKEVLGVDCLSVSLGNDDCNMHGVNENFKVDLIKKGLAFSRSFFAK